MVAGASAPMFREQNGDHAEKPQMPPKRLNIPALRGSIEGAG
jgi:hypothetical protein